MKDTLDRHKSDTNLKKSFPLVFEKIKDENYSEYLNILIRPARASQEGV